MKNSWTSCGFDWPSWESAATHPKRRLRRGGWALWRRGGLGVQFLAEEFFGVARRWRLGGRVGSGLGEVSGEDRWVWRWFVGGSDRE